MLHTSETVWEKGRDGTARSGLGGTVKNSIFAATLNCSALLKEHLAWKRWNQRCGWYQWEGNTAPKAVQEFGSFSCGGCSRWKEIPKEIASGAGQRQGLHCCSWEMIPAVFEDVCTFSSTHPSPVNSEMHFLISPLFLTRLFIHTQVSPSRMMCLPSWQCFRSCSAQLAALVKCKGTMALGGTFTSPSCLLLPQLQPQILLLISQCLPPCKHPELRFTVRALLPAAL